MIRLVISVEGQTEEEFVKRVLAEHLRRKGVEPIPIQLGSARGRSSGGNVSTKRLVSEMTLLRHSFDAVTSLVDFYGFRCKSDKTVDQLEEDLRQKLGYPWYPEIVIPYIQQYEFEGLLFSDASVFADLIDAPEGSVQALQGIRSRFQTPEDINDHKDTAPSKRIKQVIPKYHKNVDGPPLAEKIGLDKIRAECPRFNDWLTNLESLGNRDNPPYG